MPKFRKNKSTFATAFTKKSPLRNGDEWSKKLTELIDQWTPYGKDMPTTKPGERGQRYR